VKVTKSLTLKYWKLILLANLQFQATILTIKTM